MFGFKKKPQQPNFLVSSLYGKVFDSFSDDDPLPSKRKSLGNIPVYVNFYKRNTSIPTEVLQQLPLSWQPYWYRLDFAVVDLYLEGKIDSNQNFIEPEPLVIPELSEISDEKKNKLKAIVLGELNEIKEPEEEPTWRPGDSTE